MQGEHEGVRIDISSTPSRPTIRDRDPGRAGPGPTSWARSGLATELARAAPRRSRWRAARSGSRGSSPPRSASGGPCGRGSAQRCRTSGRSLRPSFPARTGERSRRCGSRGHGVGAPVSVGLPSVRCRLGVRSWGEGLPADRPAKPSEECVDERRDRGALGQDDQDRQEEHRHARSGPSHHFLRTFMKAQSSPKMPNRSEKPPVERAIASPSPSNSRALDACCRSSCGHAPPRRPEARVSPSV